MRAGESRKAAAARLPRRPGEVGTMDPTAGKGALPNDSDSMDLVSQTRSLRRKVTFWRRAAWMILGAAAVFLIVFWNRGETRRRECRASLQHYLELAHSAKLATQRADLIELHWNQFEPPTVGLSPMHFDLIVRNWGTLPKAGERIPLAICRDRHITTLSIGRHLLYATEKGLAITWLDEEAAQEYVEDARRDNRTH